MNRKLQLALVACAIVVAGEMGRAALQSAPKTEVLNPVTTIPFELVNRHIVLKVKVDNSTPLSFVLDTGSQFAIINLDRAKELGLKLEGTVKMGGAGAGTADGAFVQETTFAVPGLTGFSQPIKLALPLTMLAPKAGHDFDGILGSEFIQEFVVEVDYPARQLRLHRKANFKYDGKGESIPIQLTHGHPIISAEVTPIGGQPLNGRFVLDLGSGMALALHSPFVAEHRLLSTDSKTIRFLGGMGAGGRTSGRVGRISELKIGSYKLKNPVTVFSEDKAGALANSSLAGNIGAQVANRFKVFLDYSNNRIILEPNENYSQPFDRAFAGISLTAEGKNYQTFRVDELLENSPATDSGLKVNDIITEINGKDASELTLSRLNEMLEQPVEYKLVVRRGQETVRIVLTPKKLI